MSTYTLGQIGLNFRDVYNASITYSALDVVTYNGSSYVAIASTTGNDPTDTIYWKKLAQGYEDAPDATYFTLTNGAAPTSNYGNGNLRWRKIGKHVFLSGGVNVKYNGSNIILATLPSEAAPVYGNVYSLRACAGSNIVRFAVSTNGNVYVSWIKNLTNGANNTTDTVWIDCNFDYWID